MGDDLEPFHDDRGGSLDMVKRVVVGAHYGIIDWLVQRVSAATMAVFTILFLVVVLLHPHNGFEDWKALFSQGWLRIGMLLFFLCLFLHAWVGMRDILMDYVHSTGLRLTLQVLVLMSLAVYAFWAVAILWGK